MQEIPVTLEIKDTTYGRALLIIEPAEGIHEVAAVANLLARIVSFYVREGSDEDDG
jgi:hypothetical protein